MKQVVVNILRNTYYEKEYEKFYKGMRSLPIFINLISLRLYGRRLMNYFINQERNKNMQYNHESIYGMRRPTEQEHAWIAELWSEEVRERLVKKSGKGFRYFGIFLIAMAVITATQGIDGMGAAFVLMMFGGFCILFGRSVKRNSNRKDFLLNAFAQGNYMVAPANSTEIRTGGGSGRPLGYVRACLPNGEPVEGIISIPHKSILSLLRQRVHCAPILLIQIPGYPKILAIPAPQ